MTASYNFKIGNFKVIKNGATFFEDGFEDGVPPPSSPTNPGFGNNAYNPTLDPNGPISGTFTESGGFAIMDGSQSATFQNANTTWSFHAARVITNSSNNPADINLGLKNDDNITVVGIFALVMPDDAREEYGIRLTDQVGVDGTDLVSVSVSRGTDGIVRVQLTDRDLNAGVMNIFGSVALNPGTSTSIMLKLVHSVADPGKVTAQFELFTNGVSDSGPIDVPGFARIFGTDTVTTADDELWTRAQFFAASPDPDNIVLGILEGTENNDTLSGASLANDIQGFGGNDRILGFGNNDTMNGGDGDDTLIGGTGADSMRGGNGNDTYFIDDAGDQAIEFVGGVDQGGIDLVFSKIDYTLGDGLEKLRLANGSPAVNGTGNASNNTLIGNDLGNVLSGLDGNDKLYGGAGNDELRGGAQNDYLTGEAGDDTMYGGSGDDRYIVDSSGDVVSEDDGLGGDAGGADRVDSSVDFELPDYLDRLYLMGTAIRGRGNDLSNKVIGNEQDNELDGAGGNDRLEGAGGNDSLMGGAGVDLLIGGADADSFMLGAPGGGNWDRIGDFNAGEGDTLVVQQGEYGLSYGDEFLHAEDFAEVASATNVGHGRFLFNDAINQLFWDADGNAATGNTLITKFDTDVSISNLNIYVLPIEIV
jgi:Ca2+-binding RTX toxin-like protein